MKTYNIGVYLELRNEGFSASAALFYARKWVNLDYKADE